MSTNELKAPESDCPYCNGTGEADSGGIHPWGEPATIPCRCMYEDPFHVHVSKFDAITAERDSLRAVNADLLAALEVYEAWAHKTICTDVELKKIREQIRAAIARATAQAGTDGGGVS